MKTLSRYAALVVLLLSLPIGLLTAQGVTTASIFGKLVDAENGDPLIGATVQAVHTPSGTTYGNVTNVDGYFRLPGVRVGGPYNIVASYVGFAPITETEVYLTLGQAYEFSPKMGETAIELEGVTVRSSRSDIFNGEKTGAETTVTEEQINVLPTISRSIGDFTRLTPQSTTREGNDGFELSFGGINNRYNAIYIDGAVNNDVFGLAGSGTNGGQTGVSPISVDAIESFQINLAPFDVRQGGFGGAAINAITRSGSNNTEASVYGFYRDENTVRQDLNGAVIDPFTAYTTGARIGGAIVRDKLFYFVNYERQEETTPLPFNPEGYLGQTSLEGLNSLADVLRREYDYEPGTFTNNERFLQSDKLTAKFDYNLNATNKLALRLSYVGADNLEGVQSNVANIRFLNSSERFVAKTYGAALTVNSIIGTNMSNDLTIGFTAQRDDRDPNGDPFPSVVLMDGSGTEISFGSEPFSTANLLNQDILTINNNFEIFSGIHTITLGANLELSGAENLFIPFNYGSYEFNSVDDFLNGENASFFSRSFSLRDNVIGDESEAITRFNSGQAGLYFQDRIQASSNFSLTAGLRLDLPFYDNIPLNEDFNQNALPLLRQYYDLRGARSGAFIKPQVMISPRVGFNWDILGDKTNQVRGGIGIFTSRAPNVWVGGAYNNYGLNRGSVRSFNEQPFIGNVNNQPPGMIDLNNPEPSGDIDLFAEDFKLPQFLKANLAFDRKLPFGFIGTIDILYNKTLQNVAYQNLNIQPATDLLEGADRRPYYGEGDDEIAPQYQRILLGYNTTRGYGYNITASLQRPFDNGLFVQTSYSYGDAYSVFDGTSSQNSSQWRGLLNVFGRNIDQRLYRSDFAGGHRLLGVVSYTLDWKLGVPMRSTFTFLSETAQSGTYSLIYDDNGRLNGRTDSREANLIYIPANKSEINLVDATFDAEEGVVTADEQWAALDRFLSVNPHTKDRRGDYAQRNGAFGPWNTVMDFRFVQDIRLGNSKNRIQLTFDAFNITNLINEQWGRREFIGGNQQIINFIGFEDATLRPRFTFDPGRIDEDGELRRGFDDRGIQSSRFQGQVGVRYIFE